MTLQLLPHHGTENEKDHKETESLGTEGNLSNAAANFWDTSSSGMGDMVFASCTGCFKNINDLVS